MNRRVLQRFKCMLLAPILLIGACQNPGVRAPHDNPKLATFVGLLMPTKIEIQHYLTKPADFNEDGDADGLEVILSTYDSFGDSVKCLGTFHFELHVMRMASGDKLGKQIAHWPVEIDTGKTMIQYWDRLTHSYSFPLKLRAGTLPHGRYILTARLITPTEQKLFDTYEFSYGGA